jgi:hypothetical protein
MDITPQLYFVDYTMYGTPKDALGKIRFIRCVRPAVTPHKPHALPPKSYALFPGLHSR